MSRLPLGKLKAIVAQTRDNISIREILCLLKNPEISIDCTLGAEILSAVTPDGPKRYSFITSFVTLSDLILRKSKFQQLSNSSNSNEGLPNKISGIKSLLNDTLDRIKF